jgi:hypothetical protein
MTKKYSLLYGGKYGTIITTTTGFEHIRFTSSTKESPAAYITDNEEIQKALEAAKNFNVIYKVEVLGEQEEKPAPKKANPEPEKTPGKEIEAAEFPDVTTLQEAKEILSGDPYNIKFKKTPTPDNILSAATEVGASFPNIKK